MLFSFSLIFPQQALNANVYYCLNNDVTTNMAIQAAAERAVFRQFFSCCNYEKCPWFCSCLEPVIVPGVCVTGVRGSECPATLTSAGCIHGTIPVGGQH